MIEQDILHTPPYGKKWDDGVASLPEAIRFQLVPLVISVCGLYLYHTGLEVEGQVQQHSLGYRYIHEIVADESGRALAGLQFQP
jgi:hypothetical protein